ncbi:MAG: phosphoglucomutase/phosphomannomutase family protein [Chloroflexi bacterium]|nr:phosphoglucomutase/phosphomannomutase family protein [Chloroflexota bacterium]
MTTRIRFGTDGWRGIIADDYTFANVRICAQSVADHLISQGDADRGAVVGYDLRFASEDFAAAAAEVFAGNGIRTYLCDRSQPTPVISFGILDRRAGGGVTITASHNPPIWNGFKVRSHYGGAAAPAVIAELEQRIEAIQAAGTLGRLPCDEALAQGSMQLYDPAPAYLDHLRSLIDFEPIRRAGLKVVVDAMHGSGLGWFPRMIGGGATEVVEIRGQRDPYFGGVNPEPIPRNLQKLLATVQATGAGVGIATDGDADRLGVCDEHGAFIDQLRVYSLIALYLLEVRGWRGPIVKTLSTSSMLDRLGELYQVPVHTTGVGFKYVAPKMLETNALVGGEESGGYAFRGHLPERDGLLAGLFILDLVIKTGRTPSQLVEYLFSKVGPHYYDRLDLHFPAEQRAAILRRLEQAAPADLNGSPVTRMIREDGYKYIAADGSWLLIRFSGTEPIMRIYTETSHPGRVRRIIEIGRELAGV